ncbi:hypothetical protein [Stenotrophomonas phage vB_SmaS_BUCT548]|uniref:Uncharacterized protein n=1 Tax=Stenotrophomonas phage vB_SmaS_BUCT548 TaxID=2712941 RepID=A0A7D2LHW1_9CAUD|nr:hypothetical protein PQD75_gp053 [Stenotrophomonas phage vB_SmaS_BUCT548]QIQ60819.1 hypothetical protein [Stenotrophomonas phage vB_SmaS_BUCT548]
MNLRLDPESVAGHIRDTLCLSDDSLLLVGGQTVSLDHTGQLGSFYRIKAHIKVIPAAFREGPYTSFPWITISYLTKA